MAGKRNRKSIAAPQKLLAAVLYLVLIGVVIYGKGHHVYDGFGDAVPWVIGGIFAVMFTVRVWGFVSSIKAERVLREYSREKRLQESELPDDELYREQRHY